MSRPVVEYADVGNHHVNRVQADVPLELLEDLGAEPGDQLRFQSLGQGAAIVGIIDGGGR